MKHARLYSDLCQTSKTEPLIAVVLSSRDLHFYIHNTPLQGREMQIGRLQTTKPQNPAPLPIEPLLPEEVWNNCNNRHGAVIFVIKELACIIS